MPIRKTSFYEDGFYHVYNRGVERRNIFLDQKDYKTFSSILSTYMSPETIAQGRALRIKEHRLHEEVTLLAYCLMPNHFHFLIKQRKKDSITRLMRRLLTAYSMYFNEKYERVGSLFQGRFKAKEIETDDYLLHLSRYIHRNPIGLEYVKPGRLENFVWSSYPNYLGKVDNSTVKPAFILNYFSNKDKNGDYKNFVEFESGFDLPKDLIIEE